MTELLPNSCFLHIPKTGGSWVRAVLKDIGLSQDVIRSIEPRYSTENIVGSYHCVPTFDHRFLTREHRFCFVRHPLTWYQSYWAFKVENDTWNPHNRIDSCCRDDQSFQSFIDKVLKNFPNGYLIWLYNFYVSYATFVGKQENLQFDLARALNIAKETFLDEKISRFNKRNSSSEKYKKLAQYRPEQINKIMKIEERVVKYFHYNYIPVITNYDTKRYKITSINEKIQISKQLLKTISSTRKSHLNR